MRAIVRKWGNSAAVRIPASVMQTLGLHLDQTVDVREEQGHIVIEPIYEPAEDKSYELHELLDRITDDNRHAALDLGQPEGNEVW